VAGSTIVFTPGEIASYYGTRVPGLTQRGRRWRGACPIHGGTHDSFSVDSETGLWRCWSNCGRGGNLINFEMTLTGAAWREAATEIARIIGRKLLDRPANRSDWWPSIELRAVANATTDDIECWEDALTVELNARKIKAVEDWDETALAEAASLCNVLENGSPEEVVREFIRHRTNDPTETARLIVVGRERNLEAQRITAEAVLYLTVAAESEKYRENA
jgi:hypothetical protein